MKNGSRREQAVGAVSSIPARADTKCPGYICKYKQSDMRSTVEEEGDYQLNKFIQFHSEAGKDISSCEYLRQKEYNSR